MLFCINHEGDEEFNHGDKKGRKRRKRKKKRRMRKGKRRRKKKERRERKRKSREDWGQKPVHSQALVLTGFLILGLSFPLPYNVRYWIHLLL